MRRVALDDALFRGAVTLERGDGWIKPWRIPFADFDLYPPNGIGGTARGDTCVLYVDGLTVFGEAHLDRLPDLLHPDAEGYRILAENFVREVAGPIFGAGGA